MFKSICVLFFVIHFVNCMGHCKNDHHNADYHIPHVDYSGVQVVPVPEWNTAAGFLDTPIWDNRTQSIYAQDFAAPNNNVYRIDYATKKIYIATVTGEGRPTNVMPVEGCPTRFMIGFEPNMTLCDWDGVSPNVTQVRTLFQGVGHIDKAWVDLKGRMFVGTSNITIFCQAPAKFPLYRYDRGKVTLLVENLKTTTGVCIDQARHYIYVADLCYYQIVRFILDLKTGDICKPVIVLDLKTLGIYPLPVITHLTIDKDGRLYCTMYRTGEVWVIDPFKGIVLYKIIIPSPGTTTAVFAGPLINDFLVFVAKVLINEDGGAIIGTIPDAPTVFRVTGLNAVGYDNVRVKLNCDNSCN